MSISYNFDFMFRTQEKKAPNSNSNQIHITTIYVSYQASFSI